MKDPGRSVSSSGNEATCYYVSVHQTNSGRIYSVKREAFMRYNVYGFRKWITRRWEKSKTDKEHFHCFAWIQPVQVPKCIDKTLLKSKTSVSRKYFLATSVPKHDSSKLPVFKYFTSKTDRYFTRKTDRWNYALFPSVYGVTWQHMQGSVSEPCVAPL